MPHPTSTPMVFWQTPYGRSQAYLIEQELGDRIELRSSVDGTNPTSEAITILVDSNPTEAMLDNPSLEHVIVPWAGLSPALCGQVVERPHLKLYNAPYNAPFVAQHTLALLLSCMHRLCEADEGLRKGDWRPRVDPAYAFRPLSICTAAILGYGLVGKAIADALRAWGTRIIAVRKNPTPEPDATCYGIHHLSEAVREADIVIACLPHTPETEKIVNATVFAVMQPSAVFINVGRGPTVDAAALYQALTDGTIQSAGIDVWWDYPTEQGDWSNHLPDKLPFHTLSNVVLSPHRA